MRKRNLLIQTLLFLLWVIPTALPVRSVVAATEETHPEDRWKGLGIIGSIPHHSYGLFYVQTWQGGSGIYVDVKLTLPETQNQSDYFDDISPRMAEVDFGHRLVDVGSNWASVNLALIHPAGDHLLYYTGLGITRERRFREYFDPLKIITYDGHYWVDDEDVRATHLNIVGGLMTAMLSDVRFLLGGESKPFQVTLGMALKF